MEKICEYCRKKFDAKRVDTVYCSHSCRQMAYLNRKFLPEIASNGNKTNSGVQKTSIDTDRNNDKASIDVLNQPLKPSIDGEKSVNPSIDVSQNVNKNGIKTSIEALPVNTEVSINQSQNVNSSIDVSEKNVNSDLNKDLIEALLPKNDTLNEKKDEYSYVQSKFTKEVIDIGEEGDIQFVLLNLFSPPPAQEQVKWVSLRFRCLIECLLMFSEMKYVDINDLKEVCNAFTLVIQSDHFKYLPESYPYTNEIIILRDNLKNICIENNHCGQIRFRLTKSKKQLMATRWQLAYYVPKRKFKQLNFKSVNSQL